MLALVVQSKHMASFIDETKATSTYNEAVRQHRAAISPIDKAAEVYFLSKRRPTIVVAIKQNVHLP